MIQTANAFLFSSIKPKSFGTYRTALKRFKNFCEEFNLKPVLTQHNLRLFVTYLASGVTPRTIGVYLSGLRYFSSISGSVLPPTKEMKLLSYTLRGIRLANIKASKPPRDPITMAHLNKILWFLRNCELGTQERRLWWAVSLLAFYGLLRSAEYCCHAKSKFITETTLLISDLQISQDMLVVRIRQSKTDPFHYGQSVTIGATNTAFCPVAAMRAYLQCRGFIPGPLFVFNDGSFLTRPDLSNFLTQCFPLIQNINTHSFRIGGASALALAGVPIYAIQAMGRWKSDCFRIYLRFPEGYRKYLAVRMSNTESLN